MTTVPTAPARTLPARLFAATDARLVRSSMRSARYVLVRLQAPPADLSAPPRPLHVALVLDRSGSMGGDKIRLAREAAAKALQMLRPIDRFSLVCFDYQIDVVQPSTPATPEAIRSANHALNGIEARGGTNLSDAWSEGCRQLSECFSSAAVTRCILLTDGQANAGITDSAQLTTLAGGLRTAGIHTSAFGLGRDFDEMLLTAITTAGGGRFCYVEHAAQIPDFLQSELGEALEVTVRGVTLQLRPSAGVSIELLSHFDVRDVDGGRDIAVGDLLADQELEIGLRIKLPRNPVGESMGLELRATDRDLAFASAQATLQWTSADDPANGLQTRDADVRRACAILEADKARYQALACNRAGDYTNARAHLQHILDRLAKAAQLDRHIQTIVHGLHLDLEGLSRSMDESLRKKMQYATSLSSKSRDAEGSVKRSRDPRNGH